MSKLGTIWRVRNACRRNLGGAGEDDTYGDKILKSRAFLQHFIDKYDLTDELTVVEGCDRATDELIEDDTLYDKSKKVVRTPPPKSGNSYCLGSV